MKYQSGITMQDLGKIMISISHQTEWQRHNLCALVFDLPQIEDITVNNSKHKHNLVNKVGDW